MNSALQEAVNGYLHSRAEEEEHKRRKERYRDALRAFLMEDGREDGNGHRVADFPELTIGGISYRGIAAQRRVSASIDLGKAEALARAKDAYDEVFPVVERREFNEDALYILNQRGVVSDDELDGLITESVTFAIVPVKS